MFARRTAFSILLLMGAWSVNNVTEGQTAVPGERNSSETQLSRRLQIYRVALLQGPSEQTRVDAAMELLLSEDESARQILMSALADKKSGAARAAVCTALSQSRSWSKLIKKKGDFLLPMLAILRTADKDEAKLAAQALVVFEYGTIKRHLKEIIANEKEDYPARLNAIYALRLRPEMEAIIELIKLREHSERAIAATAEKELQDLLGIPVGTDEQTWREVLKELRRKNRYEFMRDRLVGQGFEINRLKGELQRWQKGYLSALDEVYEAKSEEGERGAFLVKHLGSEWANVRLWALEKVRQWRLSGKALPVELAPKLAKLIADTDAQVRLSTAELLGRMGDLNLAKQLLNQLRIEKQEEVKIELLGALGEACFTVLSLNPEGEASEQIRKIRNETLVYAGEYIADTEKPAQAQKLQKAAGVIRKLLEHEGLEKDQITQYLTLLAGRYAQEQKEDGSLRGELLNAMAGLCAVNVDCRAESARLFRLLFMEGLKDTASAVRTAAVSGLINIDKAGALSVLKEEAMMDDESTAVRSMVIELAGTVGGKEDLEWLADNLGNNGVSEPAWQAMRKIFERFEASVAVEWSGRFESGANADKGNDEELLYLLETAQEKAAQENNLQILKYARNGLADLYSGQGKFKEAAKYYGMLFQMTEAEKERDDILGKLVEVDLKAGEVAAVKQLAENRLLTRGDLGPDDVVSRKVSEYFAKVGGAAEGRVVLEALLSIKNGQAKPKWAAQLQQWQQLIGYNQGGAESTDTADPG